MAKEVEKENGKVLVATRSIGITVDKKQRSYKIGDVIADEHIEEIKKLHKVFIPDRSKKDKEGKWDGSGSWVDDTKGLASPAYAEMSVDEAKALAAADKELKVNVAKAKKALEDARKK